jgi:SPP1 family predicted phage head-tail adaptor
MSRHRLTIGARGRRFTVELPLESPDGFGGVTRTYRAGPQVWGAMEVLRESERVRAGRPESVVTHRVRLRSGVPVTSAMRLALGPRRFRIESAADPDGRGREIVCMVEEIGP